jgi:hypothetical protein
VSKRIISRAAARNLQALYNICPTTTIDAVISAKLASLGVTSLALVICNVFFNRSEGFCARFMRAADEAAVIIPYVE